MPPLNLQVQAPHLHPNHLVGRNPTNLCRMPPLNSYFREPHLHASHPTSHVPRFPRKIPPRVFSACMQHRPRDSSHPNCPCTTTPMSPCVLMHYQFTPYPNTCNLLRNLDHCPDHPLLTYHTHLYPPPLSRISLLNHPHRRGSASPWPSLKNKTLSLPAIQGGHSIPKIRGWPQLSPRNYPPSIPQDPVHPTKALLCH